MQLPLYKAWVMRKILILSLIVFSIAFTAFIQDRFSDLPVSIQRSPQRKGNAASGWNYLVNGNYVNSGFPFSYYLPLIGKNDRHLFLREGKNNDVAFYFNVIKGVNNKNIVVPNCLQCHAEVFDGKLIIGLGRATGNFTNKQPYGSPVFQDVMNYLFKKIAPGNYAAAEQFIKSAKSVRSEFLTRAYGSNPGARLTATLMNHHNPNSLEWSNHSYFNLTSSIIPSDVPAWWLLKKKAAMYYSGEARGDFGKFMMVSSLLTLTDTLQAKEIDGHMPDVLAFIEDLTSPPYPKKINQLKAKEGEKIFTKMCSSCHGTYGNKSSYPNLLIPQSITGTDSLLWQNNFDDPMVVNWYNQSWFSKGPHGGTIIPYNGYIAPPLDGIWITAPYLHNGSVPTLEALLNSRLRPKYWSANFNHPQYDYNKLGWKYSVKQKPGNVSVYNTTLPGYGNYGHYFGDALTDEERQAVIEYLKTL